MRQRAFTTTIEAGPSGAQIIPLPFDPDAAWGSKDRHHVAGTVAGIPIRGALMAVEGGWAIQVGPSWGGGPGVGAGRVVAVVLEPEGPQFDDLPVELRSALAADPEVRRQFESLATFYRKGFVDPIAAAKGADTRVRRAHQVLEALRAGRQNLPLGSAGRRPCPAPMPRVDDRPSSGPIWPGARDRMAPAAATERSHRGLVQRFAKPPCGVTCIEGSNSLPLRQTSPGPAAMQAPVAQWIER